MNKDKYVFAQLVEFLDCFKFRRIVTKYNGDKYVKHLTCWNQFLAMMFGQLANRESLRDLIVALDAHRTKCYTWGWVRTYRNHHSLVQIKIETIAYLRSSPSTSLERQERGAIMTSLNLEVMSMPSTPQPLTFVYLSSGGRSFERRKVD